MATETVHLADQQARLEAVKLLCRSIVSKLSSAHAVLLDDEASNLAVVVATMLSQLAWMADKAAVIAGDGLPHASGKAEDWMLDQSLRDLLLSRGL